MTESIQDALDYEELATLLQLLRYTEAPSHFHGALCGTLCVADTGQFDVAALVMEGADSAEALDGNARAALNKLARSCAHDLASNDMVFEPLLPGDAIPLKHRVESLAAWSGGFLYGMSSKHQLDLQKMSEDARETMTDLAQFSQAGFDGSGEPEQEEAAYMELVEYVRVAAQLLFLELRPRGNSVSDPSTTVH